MTISNQNGVCHRPCENLISWLATRFAYMENKGVIAVATLLDQRLKKIPFKSESSVEKKARRIIGDAVPVVMMQIYQHPLHVPRQTLAPLLLFGNFLTVR